MDSLERSGLDLRRIPCGDGAPARVDAVIEIPRGSRVKYEYDPDSGLFRVSRVLRGAMRYPVNYGFIPGTEVADGDCLDILTVDAPAFASGSIVALDVVGALFLIDGGVEDAKIVGRPAYLERPGGLATLDDALRETLEQFFAHYKELEGKPVELRGWLGKNEARKRVRAALGSMARSPSRPRHSSPRRRPRLT